MYIHIYLSLSLYIYIYTYIYIVLYDTIVLALADVRAGRQRAAQLARRQRALPADLYNLINNQAIIVSIISPP